MSQEGTLGIELGTRRGTVADVATPDDAALHHLAIQAIDPGSTGQQAHDAGPTLATMPIAMEEHSVRALSI